MQPGRPAPRLRLSIRDLPPNFVRSPEAAKRIGRKDRMVRIHAAREGIAIIVVRPKGGPEYAIHADGVAAIPMRDSPGDTGVLHDARHVVATFADLAKDLWPADTGGICDARRAVASRDAG